MEAMEENCRKNLDGQVPVFGRNFSKIFHGCSPSPLSFHYIIYSHRVQILFHTVLNRLQSWAVVSIRDQTELQAAVVLSSLAWSVYIMVSVHPLCGRHCFAGFGNSFAGLPSPTMPGGGIGKCSGLPHRWMPGGGGMFISWVGLGVKIIGMGSFLFGNRYGGCDSRRSIL